MQVQLKDNDQEKETDNTAHVAPDMSQEELVELACFEIEGTNVSQTELPSEAELQQMDKKGLLLFINGLRLFRGRADQVPFLEGGSIHTAEDAESLRDYWRTDENTFGRRVDMVESFEERLGASQSYFTSGSSTWDSQAPPNRDRNWVARNTLPSRHEEGIRKARRFHRMVQSGEIVLRPGEPINIISHSQGGAHAAGFTEHLLTYTDDQGAPLYNVESIYYITPHQPTDIDHPEAVHGIQYSRPNDAVSSNDPWWLYNGGSEFGRIEGVDEFDGRDILGVEGTPEAEGPAGNRGGHNVTDNDFIFQIPEGQPGHVRRVRRRN
ncbi:MAG: hypothetical protein ACFB0B_17870 [Thermonemataceae bacterium]